MSDITRNGASDTAETPVVTGLAAGTGPTATITSEATGEAITPMGSEESVPLTEDEIANLGRAVEELEFYRTHRVWEMLGKASLELVIRGLMDEPVYCSAMGGTQSLTGVALHQGDVGLRSLLLADSPRPDRIPDLQNRLTGFVAVDTKVEELSDEAKAQLASAGVSPAGTRHWPRLDSLERARPRRLLRGSEFELVADALAVVNQTAIAMAEDLDAFWAQAGRAPHKDSWLIVTVRQPEPTAAVSDPDGSEGEPELAYSWAKHAPQPALLPDYRLTDAQTQAARKLRHDRATLTRLPLECYGFHFPGLATDDHGPYLPYSLVLLEGAEGRVIDHHEFTGVELVAAEAVDWVLTTLPEKGVFPSSIVVCHDDTLAALANLCQTLGVPLTRTGHLPHAVEVHMGMLRSAMAEYTKAMQGSDSDAAADATSEE